MAKHQIPDVKPGDRVTAHTYPSLEYDWESQSLTGTLEVRYVESLGYDQYLVDGIPVDPKTVRPA